MRPNRAFGTVTGSRIFGISRFTIRFLAALFTLCGSLSASQTPGTTRKHEPLTASEISNGYRAISVIVQPRNGIVPEGLDAVEAAEGYALQRSFPALSNMRVLLIPAGVSAKTAISHLQSTGRYDFASLNKIHRVQAVPNDTYFAQQWSLQNTGASGGRVGADVKAVSAWDIQHDATSVIVAVIDTGVRLTHPDILANLWTNTAEVAGNGIDDDHDGYIDDVHGINATIDYAVADGGTPTDNNGHGTHVAGIIGASGNNSLGIAGVAWRVQIMALKAAGSDGRSSLDDELECIQYAIRHHAQIINASYGRDVTGGGFNQAEYSAMNSARGAGIIVVAAAGNDTVNIDLNRDYPACYSLTNVIAVGSSEELDGVSNFSNYGSGSCELFAPGSLILSLYNGADTGSQAYAMMSGTSMSAPLVTGALALLKAKFPTDTYRQTINRLLRGVDPITAFVGKAQTGGRLNISRALSTTDNRPFNDDFATRALLQGANVSVRSSNEGATTETGEPKHANTDTTSSLWWDWVAPTSGQVTIDSSGSIAGEVIAIYTGSTLATLSPVTGTYDTSSGQSYGRLTFAAVSGTTYHIAAASGSSAKGLIIFSLGTVPDNNSFASAQILTGLSPSVAATNINASREAGEPTILGQPGGRSVWFKWTAPKTALYQASAYSLDFDPIMAVYTGSTLTGLTLVTANDDPKADLSNTSPLCSFNAAQGVTYVFCVDSKDPSNSGQFTLSLADSAWQFVTSSSITNSPAVGADGTIYLTEGDRYINAINPDGSLKWNYDTYFGCDTASVSVVEDGTVIVPDAFGYISALKTDGSLRWEYDTGYYLYNSPAVGTDGTIYIKTGDGSVHAVDLATGTRKWRYETGDLDTYAGVVIGSDGTLYVGGGDKAFHAISANGSRLWRFATDQDVYTSAGIDSSGNLYFATTGGTFYSLTSTGTLRWSKSFPPSVTSSPAIGKDGIVYFAGYDHKLHALNGTDGSERWAYTMGDEVRASSPVIADDGKIYVGCYDGKLHAVNADGTLFREYSTGNWIRSSPVIANKRLYVASNDRKLYAFDIDSNATTAIWPMRGCNPSRLGRKVSDNAAIYTQPKGMQALIGGSLSVSVTATGAELHYQWYKDGQVIAGATTSTYSKTNATIADSGSYTVVVSNTTSSKASDVAPVNVVNLRKGRIYGLSTRGPAGSGSATMIVGVAMSAGTDGKKKNLIVRGLGPELVNRSIANFLPNPQIELYQGGTRVALNKDWGGTSVLRQAFQSVSLADLPSASKDAALLASLDPSNYTFLISDETGGSGIVLGELYDTDTTPISDPARATQGRLFGISSRALISEGDNVLIAGFSFDGDAPMTLLIQGVGPSLVPQGVTNPLLKPHLDIYQGGTIVATNEKWGGSSALSQAAAKAYATTLISPSSNDCAILITLQPGTYTAILRSADSSSGVGLVEVYEVP